MALETGNYINDLNVSNPAATDAKSQGDDHFRLLKTVLKTSLNGWAGSILVTGTDAGTANAYDISPTIAVPAYVAGMMVLLKAANANTGAATINLSSLGTKTIKTVSGAAVTTGDIIASDYTLMVYDGTDFRIVGPTKNYADQLSFASALPSQTGNANKYLVTDGSSAAWSQNVPLDRSARTSNTILGVDDRATFIDVTSGTFTQTFTAAATLGDRWFCYYRNGGTGAITIDPNASETIDGLASFIMYPGETRLIVCDGSNLFSIVTSPFYYAVTTTGSFTKPPGYSYFEGLLWGAGGAGGKGGGGPFHAGGGGGGACVPFTLPASTFGASETVTIGAGGTGPSAAGVGPVGGNSAIGTILYAYGGGGGYGNSGGSGGGGGGGGSLSAGSTGGTQFGLGGSPRLHVTTDVEFAGHFGGGLGAYNATHEGQKSQYGGGGGNGNTFAGGASSYGGGGGGGSEAGTGGSSLFGGSGGAGVSAASGTNGTAPAGGGGGTNTGTKAGDGARGELRIWGVA